MVLMDEQTQIFRDIEVDLGKENVLKSPPFTRWIKNQESQVKLENLVDEMRNDIKKVITPQAIFKIIPREKTDIEKYTPPEPLLKSNFLAVGIVTLRGRTNGDLKVGSLMESLIIDSLKNVVLIQAQREIAGQIAKIAERESLKTTRAVPPGSGSMNWGIENQEFIFKNLESEQIGVQLTPSLIMKPTKTISFVMGLGHNIEQAKNLFSCEGCNRIDCDYRS